MTNDSCIYTNGTYFQNNPTWDVEDSAWKARQIERIIRENDLHPLSVCEVGCGAGEILNQLYMNMSNEIVYTGYDISPQAIELCKARKKDRLNYFLKDVNEVQDDSFDLLLAIDLIEHIDDYLGFLRALRNKAKYKIFHIPLDLSVSSLIRFKPLLEARNKVGHIHYFTKELALASLQDTGYEIIDYYYTAGSIDLPAKHFKTRLAKLPRRVLQTINKDFCARLLGGYSLMVLAE